MWLAIADNATAVDVQDNRKEQEARPRWNGRDIGDPETVRCKGDEVAIDEIRRRPSVLIAHGRGYEVAPRSPQNRRSRIKRATRLPETAMPSSLSSA